MSLLRTKAIRVGSLLAFTADPTAMTGVSLMWGNPAHLSLSRGDVVQVLSIALGDGTTWAKVQVLILRGKRAGCTGFVSVDLGPRLQRCWQGLTTTGSMEPIRQSRKPAQPDVQESGIRETAPEEATSWSFDLAKDLG